MPSRLGKLVLPLIETAAGFDALRAIAAAPGVQRLVFGSLDFQVDLGIEGDDDAVRRDTARARRLGFGAKLCLHPKQVVAVIRGLTPADTEIDRARRRSGGGREDGRCAGAVAHPGLAAPGAGSALTAHRQSFAS